MRNVFGPRIVVSLMWLLLIAALGSLAWSVGQGSAILPVFTGRVATFDLMLVLRLDVLSSLMLVMVSFLGVVIAQYARRYLDGEPRQWYFFKYLALTVAAVVLLVTASNLVMFFLAWWAISWGLHKLLLYYGERRNAVYAARKKLLVSRCGDILLLVAIALVYQAFDTFEFEQIFAHAAAGSLQAVQVTYLSWAGAFFVAGAMTKSAQVPVHFWLPETMETPTPVSALMHAGIINAGGFLILRLSPIITHAPVASLLLAVVGAVTAVYASLVMTTQNDIKRKLAYSTVSQMGMMMFACGIGAYSLALFHILAHSFYKAHAFLSTGGLVEESKKLSLPLEPLKPAAMLAIVAAGAALLVIGVFWQGGAYLPTLTYGGVLLLGLGQNVETLRGYAVSHRRVAWMIAVVLSGAIAICMLIEGGLGALIAAEIAQSNVAVQWGDPRFFISAFAYGVFAAGLWLANGLMTPSTRLHRALYVHLWNGSYFGTGSTRALSRLWPVQSQSQVVSITSPAYAPEASILVEATNTEKPASHATATAHLLASDVVRAAVRVSAPAWPLQHAVAVNPFWYQIDRHFAEVMAELTALVHAPLYMPLTYYLEKYRAGVIQDEDLHLALTAATQHCCDPLGSVAELVHTSMAQGALLKEYKTFAEFRDERDGTHWQATIAGEVSKYAAAYFDDGQALAQFPWRDLGFLDAWFAAQEFDRSMETAGLEDFRATIKEFRALMAHECIQALASRLRLDRDRVAARYFARLLLTAYGWSAPFRYHEWQKSLGLESRRGTDVVDFLGVCMLYDFALARFTEKTRPGSVAAWCATLASIARHEDLIRQQFELHRTWQTAFERSFQTQVAAHIVPQPAVEGRPRFQVAMCIDVRSEVLRRALESGAKDVDTIGFAGFFGVALDYQKVDEKSVAHHLPVLLTPALRVAERIAPDAKEELIAGTLARSYFRNLRKAPLSSFLYVELFGMFALGKLVAGVLDNLGWRLDNNAIPERFGDVGRGPCQEEASTHDGKTFTTAERVERAASVLTHMGLRRHHARLIVLAGHGSVTANNAFASGLDCGACGGHAGDINARFLASLLNQASVRAGLVEQGIHIPEDTWFVPAVHETVTDELYLLDTSEVPTALHEDLDALRRLIKSAGARARLERQTARSPYLDRSARRRSINWSEIRPEWALAGNACFIVAPRRFTRAANLAGRAFLHDYDWRQDAGFATLELIMTAPMVVANWINMQYYASTVAPNVYGAGNKLLHNLVNESGVVEGNGGDLRVGLPMQSVHDGTRFVHEPLRLSVFIAAPRETIEHIIAQHATVQQLVDNQWLHLLHINDDSGVMSRRTPGGHYVPL